MFRRRNGGNLGPLDPLLAPPDRGAAGARSQAPVITPEKSMISTAAPSSGRALSRSLAVNSFWGA
jgi:hypothetical protein